ncbi:sulfur carrier protein ThiS [Candidatus Magnetominusculus xianensis]|uniref:Thiamine biosynthesis protein ThiS n=1 Tax=Candidatus Magnetominusculus xianensis TaxID=1748249 RepID=A0ABR5SFI0_9BACT|nr:sulfur carrier protein ThiS [Candidatus Magnetominusculus xianensis]KWT82993.1 thiamine biosynthesis protein ThiS [Candidatus Magnetominusculus xianensis]MBF0402703.1 sulfur carrier protein ThiS [Nitrospirota bacterium]
MKIRLNGDDYDTKAASTISELLTALDINPMRVAVELNMLIVKKAQYDTTPIKDGDSVEIVNFVGGG